MSGDHPGEPGPELGTERPGRPARGARRRDLLLGGSAGLVLGAGAASGAWAVATDGDGDASAGSGEGAGAPATTPPPASRGFLSTQLSAAEATAWTEDGATVSAGLLLTTPRTPIFRGVIYDDRAEPVWIEPDGNPALDLRVQQYRGRPVLTYWTGLVLEGLGFGKGVLLDEEYRLVAEVRAGNGLLSDFHEFRLTEEGTALFVAYPVVPFDLSPIDGPADGWIYGALVQEVDVETGEVLLEWDGMDHLDITETHRAREDGAGESPEKPFDPVHLNSVFPDGDALLLSARHTSTIYRVDRRTGEVLWRFGGERSDIEVPEGGTFGWQHDAQRQPDGTITVYDNHDNAIETDSVSAALRFEVDEEARTATLVQALRHEDRYGYAMGNAQYLDDGHVVVGWGMDPVVTEFDESGRAVFELRGLGLGSYRGYRSAWVGRPRTSPDIAVVDGTAHVSWNGATEVARWRLRGGTGEDAGRELATVDRTGFETALEADLTGEAWVSAEALDASGEVLGRTRRVTVTG